MYVTCVVLAAGQWLWPVVGSV